MNAIKKDNTEQKIMDAAQSVFMKKGMDGTRMQEIADEAGINKALVHYYFRSKQKLFEAIFKQLFKKAFPSIKELIYSDTPIEEKIRTFVDKYMDLLLKNPYLPMFILKEINRDPQGLASIIKSQGVNPNELFLIFEKEMEKGTIWRMNPKDLLINMLGLSIFPIAARPLMTEMFFDGDKKAYKTFLLERKNTVTEFILNSILIK
ncbi:MAG: TetR/AcrR family transcriptional regulator [Prolixibacteraceae bacterium]|nr:TetR/AcrR family transcriptional regulator [Prolixibacteraceae bacterium]MBN2775631.1 TetR/AcrR family transcriptional regulator [Prolixibacteraceae bacterium]